MRAQVEHALALGEIASAGAGPAAAVLVQALDLGTGGGLPGLVLAAAWADSAWVLLDSRERSVAFVEEAVARLELGERVTALAGRAEEVGRHPAHRGRYGLVTARGFGPPAVTAECGAPLLEVGGRLVVSEPPDSRGDRWPAEPLEQLGLVVWGIQHIGGATAAVLEQVRPCPSTYPRRTGVPAKRPLF